MKHVKMYEVTFNYYYNKTDYNTVSTYKFNEYNEYVGEDGRSADTKNGSYLHIPNPFIIREDEIEKYKKYGCGYKSLRYVGSIIDEENN